MVLSGDAGLQLNFHKHLMQSIMATTTRLPTIPVAKTEQAAICRTDDDLPAKLLAQELAIKDILDNSGGATPVSYIISSPPR